MASWVLARRVTVLSLGEEAASGLGVNVGKSRTLCLLVVLVLAGAAVALAGPVAFVGLMVPHMVRRFVGSDYRAVIPASMVGGALFMLLAGYFGRLVLQRRGPAAYLRDRVVRILVGLPATAGAKRLASRHVSTSHDARIS